MSLVGIDGAREVLNHQNFCRSSNARGFSVAWLDDVGKNGPEATGQLCCKAEFT